MALSARGLRRKQERAGQKMLRNSRRHNIKVDQVDLSESNGMEFLPVANAITVDEDIRIESGTMAATSSVVKFNVEDLETYRDFKKKFLEDRGMTEDQYEQQLKDVGKWLRGGVF